MVLDNCFGEVVGIGQLFWNSRQPWTISLEQSTALDDFFGVVDNLGQLLFDSVWLRPLVDWQSMALVHYCSIIDGLSQILWSFDLLINFMALMIVGWQKILMGIITLKKVCDQFVSNPHFLKLCMQSYRPIWRWDVCGFKSLHTQYLLHHKWVTSTHTHRLYFLMHS